MDAHKEVTLEIWRTPEGQFRIFMQDNRVVPAEGDDGFFPIGTAEAYTDFDTAMHVIESEVGFALYGDKEEVAG